MNIAGFGGYVPEIKIPRLPSQRDGTIPGVWRIDIARQYLDQTQYTSSLPPAKTIYALANTLPGGGYYGGGWPRSLFNVSNPTNKSLGCQTGVNFKAGAFTSLVDYGYPFLFYWERQLPGSDEWEPVPIETPGVITNKLRLGTTSYRSLASSETSNRFSGYIGSFRYSSNSRHSLTGATTLVIPPGEQNTISSAGSGILAYLDFNVSSATNLSVVSSQATPPTLSSSGVSMTTEYAPQGSLYSGAFGSGHVSLVNGTVPDTSYFTRNPGNFCLEVIFRVASGPSPGGYYSSGNEYEALVDLRPTVGTDTDSAENIDGLTLSVNTTKNYLQVRRGGEVVIEGNSRNVLRPNNNVNQPIWYHALLNSTSGVWRLYLRELSTLFAPQIGRDYVGGGVRILKLRDLTPADDGTRYRAKVFYGALRSKYTGFATLSAIAVEFTWVGPRFDYTDIETQQQYYNIPNLVGEYAIADGTQVDAEATASATDISGTALTYAWQYAAYKKLTIAAGSNVVINMPTLIAVNVGDVVEIVGNPGNVTLPAGTTVTAIDTTNNTITLSNVAGGTGYAIGVQLNIADPNTAGAVYSGTAIIKSEDAIRWVDESWTPTQGGVDVAPDPPLEDVISWLPYPITDNDFSFTPIFIGGDVLAFRARVSCGANVSYSPIRFIQRRTTT